jgi:hypothetical protein
MAAAAAIVRKPGIASHFLFVFIGNCARKGESFIRLCEEFHKL